MRFLADDLLEGRGTGARGHELVAKCVAAQFEQMGLEPARDGGTAAPNGESRRAARTSVFYPQRSILVCQTGWSRDRGKRGDQVR
jgi:hypothetical protein